jgi:hypothetical protein
VQGSWLKLHNEELVPFAKYNYCDHVKEDKIDRACSMSGREGECIQGFSGNARRKETTGKTLM